MKKILSVIMVLLFVCTTAISAQDVTARSKKDETRTELKKDAKGKGHAVKKNKARDKVSKEENSAAKSSGASAGSTTHIKADGTPDKRYKENKAPEKTVHLKKDGTPDKRYKENKNK